MENTIEAQPKMGKIRSGWELTKSAWQVLKLDKELAGVQLLGDLLAMVVSAGIIFLVLGSLHVFDATGTGVIYDSTDPNSANVISNNALLILLLMGIVVGFIVNFFSGAIIYGATERFRGGDPTIKGSLVGAWKRWRPLALFSMLMATIGLILQLTEQRVPLAGKIAVWLVGAAWSIANFFAIPVIVLDDDVSNNPLHATRRSISIIHKVWGEGAVAQVGIGLIAILTYFIYISASLSIVVGFATLMSSAIAAAVAGSILILGFLGLVMIFTTLSAIIKAALYHLATTGEAPAVFNKRLLREAITPKKARKIFA